MKVEFSGHNFVHFNQLRAQAADTRMLVISWGMCSSWHANKWPQIDETHIANKTMIDDGETIASICHQMKNYLFTFSYETSREAHRRTATKRGWWFCYYRTSNFIGNVFNWAAATDDVVLEEITVNLWLTNYRHRLIIAGRRYWKQCFSIMAKG